LFSLSPAISNVICKPTLETNLTSALTLAATSLSSQRSTLLAIPNFMNLKNLMLVLTLDVKRNLRRFLTLFDVNSFLILIVVRFSFVQSKLLRQHLRTHEGQLPFIV
jgi:hypothetical protein